MTYEQEIKIVTDILDKIDISKYGKCDIYNLMESVEDDFEWCGQIDGWECLFDGFSEYEFKEYLMHRYGNNMTIVTTKTIHLY